MSEQANCQSCSRPINGEADFGTEVDGSRSADYCSCCYREGAFTEREVTEGEMVARVIGIVIEHNIMPRAEAEARLPGCFQTLKRWRS
jgi:hypothetical protein